MFFLNRIETGGIKLTMDPHSSQFESQLDDANLSILRSLTTPWDIQRYLDSLPYVGEELNRTPLRVMQDRQCHCLDGGMLGALCLRRLGYPARILDLVPEPGTDDDHVLAIFRHNGKFGAVAKSNYAGLRFREPVFRSLRELVMSYFEVFFNVEGLKTLRGYTRPLNLATYDRYNWQASQSGVDQVVARLYSLRSVPVLSAEEAAALNPTDERSYQAGMLGANPDGLFKPGDSH